MSRKTKKRIKALITGHLGGIERALLDGEKRLAFLDFLDQTARAKRGLYALYDSKGKLYYAGKASDLARRLNQHLKDKYGESWDRMTLFLVSDSANIAELEGLIVATAKPPGNKQKPKIGQDLRKSLQRYLKKDAGIQIAQAIFGQPRAAREDKLSHRITTKKLRGVRQVELARVLGTQQPRIAQLFKTGTIKSYIRAAGKRDAVLLLLQKSPKR
jgi:GIY-YIG catalytic domain